MRGRRGVAACLVIALVAFAASEASAQLRAPRGARGGGQEKSERAPQEARVDQLEQLLEELREDLELQPAQQPAWDSYVEKVRALALDIARERARARDFADAPALKRIDHSVDVARDRLTALEDIAAAAKALYGKLSPEQQRAADPRLATLVPAVSMSQPVMPERAGQRKGPQ